MFFEIKNQGLDQIVISLGIGDVESAKTMIAATLQTPNTFKRIDYKTFNTIQETADDTAEEKMYDQLLGRVGSRVAFNPKIVKILSYILLLGANANDEKIIMAKKVIEDEQRGLIRMLERYLLAAYPDGMATTLFSGTMSCVSVLKEMYMIKKHRRFAQAANSTPSLPRIEPHLGSSETTIRPLLSHVLIQLCWSLNIYNSIANN